MDRFASLAPNPEQQASNSEIRILLEEAVEKLPDAYRTIFILRDIEDMSTAETAVALDLTEENVKVRLHRGRAMAKNWLLSKIGAGAKDAFPFMGVRCDRVVAAVFARLAIESGSDLTK